MINKRLLIKNLLTSNDENTFYDKKVRLNIESREGKAKFLKHVCALSNSNPLNNSFIVIGIEDEINKIIGVDFYDDSKIQNLVNAYLINPPKIQYENISFPRLARHKVVGLITINPLKEITSLLKGIWKYSKGTLFIRQGSNSISTKHIELKNSNRSIVESIEKHARNNIELTLDGVFDFVNQHKKELHPVYKVFKDQFVVCWAGIKKKVDKKTLFSRVDIELVNEQIRLFYSALDKVEIEYNSQSFIITEFIQLGIDLKLNSNTFIKSYYPLEKTIINFKDSGVYAIASEILFEPPVYDQKLLRHIYNNNNTILKKLINTVSLNKREQLDVLQLPTTYMVCYLNGIKGAENKLQSVKPFLKRLTDKSAYIQLKASLRVLRKLKYSQ
jgi:hypothetical protein